MFDNEIINNLTTGRFPIADIGERIVHSALKDGRSVSITITVGKCPTCIEDIIEVIRISPSMFSGYVNRWSGFVCTTCGAKWDRNPLKVTNGD